MISFDLDMTLLDHKTWSIPGSTKKALDILRRNHKIVIATGRDMEHRYSREWKELIKPDGIVHMNGARVTAGDQVIYESRMNQGLLRELLEYCLKKEYGIGVTMEDGDYYTHPEVIEAHDIQLWGVSDRKFRDPLELLKKDVYTLALIGGEVQAKDIERQFPALRLPLFAGKKGADVMERQLSKAEGLTLLSRYWGEAEDLSECIAFGDSMNDYEMLSKAGRAVAMGNAIEELKGVADYVTTEIGQDGIWNACLHLGLIV